MIKISRFLLSFRPLPALARSLCGEIRKGVGMWGCESPAEPAVATLAVSDGSRWVKRCSIFAVHLPCFAQSCLIVFLPTFHMYVVFVKSPQ